MALMVLFRACLSMVALCPVVSAFASNAPLMRMHVTGAQKAHCFPLLKLSARSAASPLMQSDNLATATADTSLQEPDGVRTDSPCPLDPVSPVSSEFSSFGMQPNVNQSPSSGIPLPISELSSVDDAITAFTGETLLAESAANSITAVEPVLFIPQVPSIPELELSIPADGFYLPNTEQVVVKPEEELVVQVAHPDTDIKMPTMRELAAFCLPSLGIWLSSPCLSLIDTSVVGVQCATSQLAALGPSTKLCDYVAYFCTVLSAATTNLAASAFARDDPAQAKHVIGSSLTISVFMGGFLMLLIGLFAKPAMMAMLGTASTPAVLAGATAYTSIRAIGYPAALLTMVLQAAFVSTKDATTPLLAVPLTALTNLLGDLIFVGPLRMGAAGAAWATVISLYVNAVSLAVLWRRKARRIPGRQSVFVMPSLRDVTKLFKFAAPLLIALAARVYMGLNITLTAVALGTVTLAANQVVECLYWLFCPFGEAISLSMQAFLPGLLAKNKRFAQQLQRTGFKASLGLGAFAAGAAAFLPLGCPGLFTSATPVIGEMAKAAPMLGSCLFFYVVACASEGMLIARKQLKVLAVSHTVNTVGLVVALRTIATRAGASLTHVWAALAICNLLRVAEFSAALRHARRETHATPGVVFNLWRRRTQRAAEELPSEQPVKNSMNVPDIANTHPHLL